MEMQVMHEMAVKITVKTKMAKTLTVKIEIFIYFNKPLPHVVYTQVHMWNMLSNSVHL